MAESFKKKTSLIKRQDVEVHNWFMDILDWQSCKFLQWFSTCVFKRAIRKVSIRVFRYVVIYRSIFELGEVTASSFFEFSRELSITAAEVLADGRPLAFHFALRSSLLLVSNCLMVIFSTSDRSWLNITLDRKTKGYEPLKSTVSRPRKDHPYISQGPCPYQPDIQVLEWISNHKI